MTQDTGRSQKNLWPGVPVAAGRTLDQSAQSCKEATPPIRIVKCSGFRYLLVSEALLCYNRKQSEREKELFL